MYFEMGEDLNLPEPLKTHSLNECQVCGEELLYTGTQLCDKCWETLRDMERKKWLGEDSPAAVFLGITYRRFAVGILLTEKTVSGDAFPLIPPQKRLLRFSMEWDWNPITQKMERVENPQEKVCWLFWYDRNDGQTKSEVFWDVGEALEYMTLMQTQGHTVTKAGFKIFPIHGGE